MHKHNSRPKNHILNLLLLISLFFPLHYFFILLRYNENVPWNDDLVLLAHLNMSRSERVLHLFEKHAEHRIAFTRLLAELLNAASGHLDFRYLTFIGNSAMAGIFGLLFILWKKYRLPIMGILAVSIFIFTPYYWINMVWAMSSVQNTWLHLFVMLSFWSYFHGPEHYRFPVALFFAISSVFTRLDGMLAVIIIWALHYKCVYNRSFLYLFSKQLRGNPNGTQTETQDAAHGRNRKPERMILSVLCAAIILGTLFLPATYSRLAELSDQPPVQLTGNILCFVLLQSGGIVVSHQLLSMFTGLMLVIATLLLSLNRNVRQQCPVLIWMSVFLLLSTCGIAVGRVADGLDAAQAPRYMLNPVLQTTCILGAISHTLPLFKRTVWPWLLLFLLLIPNYIHWTRETRVYRYDNQLQARNEMIFLFTGITDHEDSISSYIFKLEEQILQAIEKNIYRPPPNLAE